MQFLKSSSRVWQVLWKDWRQLTRRLLPAAVATDPDDDRAGLALLGLTTVATDKREARGVHNEVVAMGLERLFRGSVDDRVENGPPLAQVRQPLGAGHALAARIDEEIFLGEELLYRASVGPSERFIVGANRPAQFRLNGAEG